MVPMMKKHKKIKKTGLSKLDGLELGLAEAADLVGKSQTHVLALVSRGYLKKVGRGRYLARDVARAALAFREDDDRRSSLTEESRRLSAVRIRQVELRLAREEGSLIPMDAVQESVADILGTFRSELAGIAAASTRDHDLRSIIDGHIESAVDRCRDRFLAMEAKFASGRG